MTNGAPIIFLDFDGVIVSPRSLVAKVKPDGFDPVAVKWIQILYEKSEAQIVISSAWRKNFNRDEMLALLTQNGFVSPPLHTDWATAVLEGERQNEIDGWLTRNPTTDSWLILDDGIGLREDPKHLVQTCTDNGLGFLDMLRCCRILGLDANEMIKDTGLRLTNGEKKILGL